VGCGWGILWSVDSYWNPLAFTAMWTGAALTAWGVSKDGYPGVRRHLWLAALSVPVWWWFELVNERVQNWSYSYSHDYSDVEYAVFATVAFSTVVPALTAVTGALWGVFGRGEVEVGPPDASRPVTGEGEKHGRRSFTSHLGVSMIGAGLVLQAAVFAFPEQMYPFVWVAPFMVVDGLLELTGRAGLTRQALQGRWREAATIAAAGLVCGVLWEFWNFWATPKWEYDVPLLGFWKVFEMPLLGYGGYVPFAWSILQLVRLADAVWEGRVNAEG
jgi:hypothetical protein